MIGRRIYRLRPWLIRALIPPGRPGSYVLYLQRRRSLQPHYNGRSDHDVATRLSAHARANRGDYFSFDVHPDARTAYLAECAGYHLRGEEAINRIHPAAPRGTPTRCPFCLAGSRVGKISNPSTSEQRPAVVMTKEE